MSSSDSSAPQTSPRLFVHGEETSWRATLQGARAAKDRLGTKLMAAFLKCFVGVDRLLALEHFIVLSVPLPREHASTRRDMRATASLLASTLVELGEALQQLCNAKVVDALRDNSLWDPLNAKRKLWLNDPRLRLVRNGMGHHLGDIAAYEKGLDALIAADDDLVFAEGNGPRRHDEEHVLGWNAMFKGAGITDDDMRHVMELTHKGHTECPEELLRAWFDVLAGAGVPVVQRDTDAPSTPPR